MEQYWVTGIRLEGKELIIKDCTFVSLKDAADASDN